MNSPTLMKKPQSNAAASGVALMGAATTTAANFAIAALLGLRGTEFAGVFFAATALVAIVSNASALGTMTGQVFFMPRALQGNAPNPRGLLVLALRPVTVVSAGAAAGLWAAAGTIGPLVEGSHGNEIASMLRVLALLVPAWALSLPLLGATRGLGSMTPTVAVNQIFRPGAQLLSVGGVLLFMETPSPNLVGMAWGWPVLASPLLALLAVARLGGLSHSTAHESTVTSQEFWRYTRPRALSTMFQVALERIDVILVSVLAGAGAAGVYGAVTRFITAGNFLIFSMGQATSGPLRRAVAAQDWAKAQRLLQQTTGWMVLVSWPYFLLLAVKGTPVINLLSPAYLSGAPVLALLALGMLVNALAGPIDLTLLMLGKSRASLIGAASALIADILLAWFLIPRVGVIGAAIAWSVAVAIQNGLATVLVHNSVRLHGPDRPALVAAAGALIAVVPIGLLTPDTLIGLLITGSCAAVVHAGWLIRHHATVHVPLHTIPVLRAATRSSA